MPRKNAPRVDQMLSLVSKGKNFVHWYELEKGSVLYREKEKATTTKLLFVLVRTHL